MVFVTNLHDREFVQESLALGDVGFVVKDRLVADLAAGDSQRPGRTVLRLDVRDSLIRILIPAHVVPLRATATDPSSQNGSVNTTNTTIENPAATVLSIPNSVNAAMQNSWYVPTFAGLAGIAVPS